MRKGDWRVREGKNQGIDKVGAGHRLLQRFGSFVVFIPAGCPTAPEVLLI